MVKKLVAGGAYILSESKAIKSFPTVTIAYATTKAVIGRLSALDYAHTIADMVQECDVYGVVIEGAGWYLKFSVEAGSRVLVVSLHPLAKPLRTKKGVVNP